MSNWQNKAHRVIADLCRESYLTVNRYKDGTMRKRHVPYSVPLVAGQLIECLNMNDELRAKQIFMCMVIAPEWRGEY